MRQISCAKVLEPNGKWAVWELEQRDFEMGPGYFVIAILGCADGGTSCTPVATLQTRYESAAQCTAATAPALEANNNFDFPSLVAQCRPAAHATSAPAQRLRPIPATAGRS